jgi:GTP-binding protein
MIEGYLEHRENLKAIIFLLDSRREPTKDDIALIDWLESKNKNIIFVLTKTDKLNQSELHQQSKMIKETLQIEDFIPYSTTRYKGREILQHMINKAIA